MQYIWNAWSWFRCSTTTPITPGDVPTEPPKESTTLKGWKAWAAGPKKEEVKEEPKEEVKKEEKKEEKKEDEPVPEVKVAEIAPEIKTTPLETIPEEEKKELIEDADNKKKAEEKRDDEKKDIGDEFVPHN